MQLLNTIKAAIRARFLGETVLPEEFSAGFTDPQQAISVLLYGMVDPIDVTFRHATACVAPFLIAVAFNQDHPPAPRDLHHLSLKFFETDGERRLLGTIALRWRGRISGTAGELHLFAPRRVSNFCLPRPSLWAYYTILLIAQWKDRPVPGMKMSFLERRASMASFIRPHPTVLVSVRGMLGVGSASGINIFPMNIMGCLGPAHFGFALRNDRLAGELIERAARLALSNVPVRDAALVYGLAINHTKAFISPDELPFATRPSPIFDLPVPEFALRVREMKIETVHRIGSHNFYVAQILGDTVFSVEPSLCVVHGFYQTRRLAAQTGRRGERAAAMKAALLEDRFNKRGAAGL